MWSRFRYNALHTRSITLFSFYKTKSIGGRGHNAPLLFERTEYLASSARYVRAGGVVRAGRANTGVTRIPRGVIGDRATNG
jgi:hypothetical protein